LYDPTSQKIVVRRDVVFDESKLGLPKSNEQHDIEKPDELSVTLDLSPPVDSVASNIEPRRTSRVIQPVIRYGIDEYCSNVEHEHQAFTAGSTVEPLTYPEAISSPQSKQWVDAANNEYQSLMENKTWELVQLPPGRQPISSKWVFKIKSKPDGTVDRYKARLVARGYTQKQGIDFDETYAPVVHRTSLRALLSYGLNHNMIMHQMDVVTAFLNGQLAEEIYMTQPEGFVSPGEENLVCKLNRSLYGLKQSPRCWNQVLDEYLKSLGFFQSSADQCVYVRNTNGVKTLLAVYVDDIVLLSDNEQSMSEIKTALSSRFQMKDLGQLHFCLGINMVFSDDSIKLSQPHYTQQILDKYNMRNCNSVSTPMATDVKLVKDDGSNAVDKTVYQSIVGSLLYLSTATRPDIAYAVGVLSRFTSAPTQTHLTAAKRVLRYLKGSIDQGLVYTKSDSLPVGYSDSSWADDETRHSTSGVVFMHANGPISWQSKRQSVIALSTAEAEYVAAYEATREAAWLRQLFRDISSIDSKPLTLYIDNQSAICIANNTATSKRTKHMDIRYHYIREEIADKHIATIYCPTQDMIADILTKPLSRDRFMTLCALLGVN
jgi:hypothetical protein